MAKKSAKETKSEALAINIFYRNIAEIKPNPKNPRVIRDEKFKKLVASLQEFPQMLEKRPLVCFTDTDGKFVVLGGNMRLRAAQELKLESLPIMLADDWTEEQKAEFLIKDNIGFGEWNWEELANEWDSEKLDVWGLDVPGFDTSGDIVELPTITTTFNINIKCDNPDELEAMKFKLGITSNSIHSSMLLGLLA